MEGNDWVFDQSGINCLTCTESRKGNYSYQFRSNRNGYESQSYQFSDFDEVKLISLFDFEITKGNSYSVDLEGDDDYLRKVSVEQRGDELEIEYRTNWKWWKTPTPFNESEAREELIDIWHFVVQASLELNLTPDDILEEYKKKNEINRERQRNGY